MHSPVICTRGASQDGPSPQRAAAASTGDSTLHLPDPVSASPIRSLPRSAMGQPWDWIGVGAVKPALSTSDRT